MFPENRRPISQEVFIHRSNKTRIETLKDQDHRSKDHSFYT